MTEYGSTTKQATPSSLPADFVNETREKRRKVLEGVFHRRKLMYKKYNLRKSLAYFQHHKNSPDFD